MKNPGAPQEERGTFFIPKHAGEATEDRLPVYEKSLKMPGLIFFSLFYDK